MTEHVPPSDIGAERQVLGAILHAPSILDDVADILDGTEFYRPAHETIYQAIHALRTANEPVDAKLVADQLTRTGDLTRVGGTPYLFDLIEGTITTTNATHHAAIIARCAGQRRIITAGQRITDIGYSSAGRDLTETQEMARSEVDTAVGATDKPRGITSIGEEIHDTLDALETPPELYSTPWPDIDHIIGGWSPGRLYVVGARPGVGKSVFGAQAAAHHADRHDQAVAFASLEMSRQEIHMRLLSQAARIDHTHLERHQLTDHDWDRVAKTQGKLNAMPLYINDDSSIRVTDIRRFARTVSRRARLGLVIVDYLQLMASPPGQRARHEIVAEFSRGLKLLARELHVPVLAMSQLNRASEQRADKIPSLADLRESGAVEQDSDVVILLHRDLGDDAKRTDLHVGIAKNRHGAIGGVTLEFQGHYQRAVAKAWTPHTAIGSAA